VGTFYASVTKQCMLCAKNQYQELEGQTHCRSCPARTHSEAGSYIQAQCKSTWSRAGPQSCFGFAPLCVRHVCLQFVSNHVSALRRPYGTLYHDIKTSGCLATFKAGLDSFISTLFSSGIV